MPATRIPIDGLWRCLCPSIDLSASFSARNSRHPALRTGRRNCARSRRTRQFHTSTATQLNLRELVWGQQKPQDGTESSYEGKDISANHAPEFKQIDSTSKALDDGPIVNYRSPPPKRPSNSPLAPADLSDQDSTNPSASKDAVFRSFSNFPIIGTSRITTIPPPQPLRINKTYALDSTATTHLHDRLLYLRTREGSYSQIVEIVDYLIRIRGVRPTIIYYDALIRANADAERGSAVVVKKLLDEMHELGIIADSGLYHGVIQVLAIHPDYLLRERVMQEMKERWFGLSPEGWHNLVVGLLRDRQYEVAMEKLDQMQSDEIRIQPWLYDIFMFQLCEAEELDEAFKLLLYRWDNCKEEVLPTVWYYLLDAFSKAYHYDGTKFIWKYRVQTSSIVPSDGICVSTLNLAARYGDPVLATSCVTILSSRRTTLASFHYEALLEAYVKSEDLNTSFRILGIMKKAGIEPNITNTRPLYIYLSQDPRLLSKAWESLENMFQEGHDVHVSAVNVIIEACIAIDNYTEAVEYYKGLHKICKSGPNVETFDNLLQGAARMDTKDLAMFLASEMSALGIQPSHLTYDRLILICLRGNEYEDAFLYLEEMKTVGADRLNWDGRRGWWMRRGTVMAMIRRCVLAGDERAWHLLSEMEERGMHSSAKLHDWAQQTWAQQNLEQVELQGAPVILDSVIHRDGAIEPSNQDSIHRSAG